MDPDLLFSENMALNLDLKIKFTEMDPDSDL